MTLDRYYADASIVVVARVTAVRPFERYDNAAATAGAGSTASASATSPDRGRTAGYSAIDIQPLFRQGRAFKGSLDGVTFVTSDNSASCGVPIEAGATCIIFGVPDPADPTVAYFDTCSGSRQYPDTQHRDITVDFVGTPASDLRERIRLRTERMSPPDTGGIVSPNRGYTAFAQWTPRDASNESRAVVFIDLVVDVEQSRIIYEEAATDGQIAFQQFAGACIGQCPCFVVPGSADSLPEPPRHTPTPDEANAIEILEVRTIDGFHWLHIAIYAESTCVNADASPLHAGWVPAFSMTGRFVLDTWPGGCSP